MHAVFLGLAIIAAGSTVGMAPAPLDPSPLVTSSPTTLKAASVGPTRFDGVGSARMSGPLRLSQSAPPTIRTGPSMSRRAAVAMLGAIAGIYAGAEMGYLVTKRDGCDTCGVAGAMIGVPVGATVGAIMALRMTK